VVGRVWKQLAGLGVIDSSLQFAAVFTLGFIPFLMVLSAVLGSGPSRAIVIGSGFSVSAQAGHDVTTLFTHSRAAPATQSMLGLVVAVLGGLAISHMIQTWYAKIFGAQVHGWKALARRAEWLAGVFGLVALQVVIGRGIEPRAGTSPRPARDSSWLSPSGGGVRTACCPGGSPGGSFSRPGSPPPSAAPVSASTLPMSHPRRSSPTKPGTDPSVR